MKINTDDIVFLSCIMIIPAILYSNAVVTICYGLIVLCACYKIATQGLTFSHNRPAYLYTLIFLGVLLSFLNSENVSQWQHHLIIKLPFLLMPVALSQFKSFDEKRLITFHFWILAVLCIASLPVLLNYRINQETILLDMAKGQPIPTPIEHVKYSMMNAYGVMAGLILLGFYADRLSKLARCMVMFLVLWLILYIHVLAVRTGIVIVYISTILGFCYVLLINRKIQIQWFKVSIFSVGIIVLLWNLNPSLKTKIGYMKYDWEMYQQGKGNLYSDSERIESLKIGFHIFVNNPIIGVGMGDLQDESRAAYYKQGRPDFYNYPHSQYLYILCSMGLIGLLLFLAGFLGPLYSHKNLFLWAITINYALSFMVENSFERSISIAFFILIALISILSNQLKQTT